MSSGDFWYSKNLKITITLLVMALQRMTKSMNAVNLRGSFVASLIKNLDIL
jgi:hypothetical protein